MNRTLNAFVAADPAKCTGCKVCEVACAVAHAAAGPVTAGTMTEPVVARLYLVKTAGVTMPIQCRHCEDAPCANVCPSAAITQVNNTIIIDQKACVGCKTCLLACPFGAIELAPVYREGQAVIQNALQLETGAGLIDKPFVAASKCDLCRGCADSPACVEACPEKALEVLSPRKEKRRRNAEAALSLADLVRPPVGISAKEA